MRLVRKTSKGVFLLFAVVTIKMGRGEEGGLVGATYRISDEYDTG